MVLPRCMRNSSRCGPSRIPSRGQRRRHPRNLICFGCYLAARGTESHWLQTCITQRHDPRNDVAQPKRSLLASAGRTPSPARPAEAPADTPQSARATGPPPDQRLELPAPRMPCAISGAPTDSGIQRRFQPEMEA